MLNRTGTEGEVRGRVTGVLLSLWKTTEVQGTSEERVTERDGTTTDSVRFKGCEDFVPGPTKRRTTQGLVHPDRPVVSEGWGGGRLRSKRVGRLESTRELRRSFGREWGF